MSISASISNETITGNYFKGPDWLWTWNAFSAASQTGTSAATWNTLTGGNDIFTGANTVEQAWLGWYETQGVPASLLGIVENVLSTY